MSAKKPKPKIREPIVPTLRPVQVTECDVDIVVPVFNGAEYLSVLLSSLVLYQSSKYSFKVWLADDCSPDPRISPMCREATLDRRFNYIRSTVRKQFAPNCNRAATQGKARYICFLNTDIQPIGDWLTPLVEVLQSDPQVGVVGPMLLFYPDTDVTGPRGTVQSVGFVYGSQLLPWHRFITSDPEHPRVNIYRDDLQGITGACFLTRRSLWRQIGGFHEDYLASYEDAEYCLKAKAYGFKIAVEPSSRLYHRVGGSGAQTVILSQRNPMLFLQRCRHLVRYDEHLLL